MPQHLLAMLATICLVMPVSSTLAQRGGARRDNSDLRITLPTKFETQFRHGTLNVHGTILNATGQDFDCLDLTFRTETENGMRTGTVSVIDLASRDRKDFGLRLPPGKSAEHTATSLCEAPVVLTDPGPGPIDQTDTPPRVDDQTCTLVGQLNSDRGFNAQFKESPNGPTQTSVLDTAVLLRNGRLVMSVPMDVQGTTAHYRFPDVPLGMTFELALEREHANRWLEAM